MSIFLKLAIIILKVIYFFMKLIPTKNKITMISRQSSSVPVDFALLAEEIKKEGKYKTVILAHKLEPGLKNKILYIFHMFRQMYHIATSKVVFLDSYCMAISLLNHKKKLVVIQMWHAMGALKKFGYSVIETDTASSALDKKMTPEEKRTLSNIMKMHRGYDYIFTSSEICAPYFAEAFHYPMKSMKVMPLPVVDILSSDDYKQKKREKLISCYPNLSKKKTIVYVPTFRKEEREDKIQELIDCVDYKKYNLIIKPHPLTKLKHHDERVIWDKNFSSRDMLMVADYIISDYSAICYEASLLSKPMYFYTYDYDEYIDTRNFYTDYQKEIPGFISKSAKKIIEKIEKNDYDLKKVEEFRKKYIELPNDTVSRSIYCFMEEVIMEKNNKSTKKNVLSKVKKIGKYFGCAFTWIVSYPLLLLPRNGNKICFISDTRSELGGNLKYMYDYIPNGYEKVIILKKDRRAKRTFKERLLLLKELATSKYIFMEDMVQVTAYFHFSKKQELIQLWHGPGAFKKFGYSRLIKNGGDIKKVHRGYKKYTKAIVSGEGIRKNYAEAFGISLDKVHDTGFLRTDSFFEQEYIKKTKEELYQKYPYLKKKKVILFAPTYRGTPYRNIEEGGAYYDFDKIDFEKIYKELKDEYVFIFKWHPALYNNILNKQVKVPSLEQYKDFYYDFSEYRDINELLFITDILVTDYSSVIFDYVLLDKPIVYFTYDLEEYENGRGLYYPFEEYVFGSVAKSSKELISAIQKEDLMEKKREGFKRKFMSACDGNSTKKTYHLIFKEKK